ncbi:pimeloyl-ACP methyl ester carboxylesterase [Microbacteriaceae bacterium SG_E_30_P1]|uniref:Pimeloyl-ACP methyl ester carboxylesterase n=1 Tax=Antiquaquibacter oligotrophicus TaxID=2880260 RepID=A0ABT6KMA2_9MICO|nr:alpha/beta hydrolase [Antiquaquibacter oligotrophicus]MDH6180237.1 pimeloyl-ACP methyl ester carboxylesterase [Antiquaquibacter oligotrophicus]UDF14016.1 alpha/beta hydrolase [Antiquaquibacter oligotrophicus]
MQWPWRRPPLLNVVEDVGDGPTVVLIHGIASSSVTFQNVLPLLRDSHRCITIDLLGFGTSPMPEDCDYTLADHANAIRRTIRSLRLGHPFTLVGHSMGALIAARYGARWPRSVNKLVLVSPPIYLAPGELSDDLERGRMDFYLKAYRFFRENKDFTLQNAAIVERFLAIPKAMDINARTWTPFVKSLENSIESQTTVSDLAAVQAPVEVVYGSFDQFASEGSMRIVARMRGVEVHRVAASDHLIGKRLARVVAQAVG